MFKFESYTETNVGKKRSNNEDNFFVNGVYKQDTAIHNDCVFDENIKSRNLYAVCDGMGGEEFGETASLIGVSSLCEYLECDFNTFSSAYIENANEKICNLIMENNGVRSGTTVAALYIDNNKATVYNLGDSRVYIVRNKKLQQLSLDHTLVQQMIDMEVLTPEAAKTHKNRHVLSQHLGIFPDEFIISAYNTESFDLEAGDIFLLCSDGLTDMLDDDEIENIINSDCDVKNIGKALISAALDRGGKDNITVQIIKCSEEKSKNKLIIPVIITAIIVIITALILINNNSDNNLHSPIETEIPTETESFPTII